MTCDDEQTKFSTNLQDNKSQTMRDYMLFEHLLIC